MVESDETYVFDATDINALTTDVSSDSRVPISHSKFGAKPLATSELLHISKDGRTISYLPSQIDSPALAKSNQCLSADLGDFGYFEMLVNSAGSNGFVHESSPI